jgi:hypothetical protein
VVAVPEAEPVVGALRARYDATARVGVPPHVTVNYPFVPRTEIDDEVRRSAAMLFGSIPGFAYRFEAVGRFEDATVYLEPQPADRFVDLIDRVAARWPECPPYGGGFETIVPHLTVGDFLTGADADTLFSATDAALRKARGIRGVANDVVLLVKDEHGQWSVDSRFPLARP